MTVDLFIHAANILLLLAYSVRDILWLRLFAVGSSSIAIPYFVLQPTRQWAPIGWSVLFIGINLFQAWRLFLERRPVKLTAEEEEVRRIAFPDLPPRKVLQLLAIGEWNSIQAGARVVEADTPVDAIALIVRGRVQVSRKGQTLGDLGPGEIAGSALLLGGAVPDVDAIAAEPVRCVIWDVKSLQRFLDANVDTRIVLQKHLARDLASKVQRLSGVSVEPSPTRRW